MGTVLGQYPLTDRLKLVAALGPLAGKFGDSMSDPSSTETVIERLDSLTRENPNEWVYWVALCDWSMKRGQLAQAVLASERAAMLRPNDTFTTYVVASAYRGLTNAVFLDHPAVGEEPLETLAPSVMMGLKGS